MKHDAKVYGAEIDREFNEVPVKHGHSKVMKSVCQRGRRQDDKTAQQITDTLLLSQDRRDSIKFSSGHYFPINIREVPAFSIMACYS